MRILYCSLFPKQPIQHEYENLDFFIKSSKFYDIASLFKYRLFSAHQEPLDFLQSKYKDYCFYDKIDFKYDEKMNEERGHEISCCKSAIFKYNTDLIQTYDYLFFTDSDIRIDSKDIYELCKLLEVKKDTFVNIPYALRDLKQVSLASFGCYIIPSYMIRDNPDLWEAIYTTKIIDDKICRVNAPDCNIRNSLIQRQYHELRALSVCTRHYIDNNHYIEYDEGKIKEF